MGERLAIFGAGGFAREVAPLAGPDADLVFVSDIKEQHNQLINGHPVTSFDELVAPSERDRRVVIAIGSTVVRQQIASRCEAAGLEFGRLQAHSHRRLHACETGHGVILCDFSMMTVNAKIGNHVHMNIYSYVAHDCVVGDFVTIGPSACCNGNVEIADGVYVGSGAIIREGQPGNPRRIGAGAVIGMGAVVTKDVPPGVTVVGNPARPL